MAVDASGDKSYNLPGDYRGSNIFIESEVHVPLPAFPIYTPPPLPDAAGRLPAPGDLPPGSFIPYGRNPLFTGRENDLRALWQDLSGGGVAATPPPDRSVMATIILTGLGGVGKTQLAVEFAHRYGRFFQSAHWISLADAAAVPAAVAECGRRMGLHPAFGGLSLPDQVALTEQAWAGPEHRLLLFDNCEDPALLERWRPKSGGARLLVTSRRERWPAELPVRPRPLATLDEPESIALLRRYLTEGDARPPRPKIATANLRAIAAELDELPLALGLAGRYLRRHRRVAATGYLNELRRPDLLHHPSLRAPGHSAGGHERDVWRTVTLSYERLAPAERDAPDEAAIKRAALALLARAACFAPGEPLPESLLLATLATDPPPRRDVPAERLYLLTADEGLERLLELGLLESAAGEVGRVKLHRLIARFVEEESARQDAQEAGKGLMAARAAVEEAVGDEAARQNAAGDPQAVRAWDVHLRYVASMAFERDDERAARLCDEMGRYLDMAGDLAEARPYLERALFVRERLLALASSPDAERTVATSLNNLGNLLKDQGDLTGARLSFERALSMRERLLATHATTANQTATADSLNNLGMLLYDQGDFVGARPFLERALAAREQALGPDHPDTAWSSNDVGMMLYARGDLAGARPFLERALAVRERALGPDHPDTALSLRSMGLLLKAQGDLAGARPYYERDLAVCERVFGPDHPQTATSLNNLAILLQTGGDLAGARPYHERALLIRERLFGPDHFETANSLNNLGVLLRGQGDLAGARPRLERALAVWERVLGPDHPNTATVLSNLGRLLLDQGDLSGARSYAERALGTLERVLGSEHHATVRNLNYLGSVLLAQGELDEAQRRFERALAAGERALAPEHPLTALSHHNLGMTRHAAGDLFGARERYERALSIRERALGPDHPETAQSLVNLAVLLRAGGAPAQARPYFERALAARERALGPDHFETAQSVWWLGVLAHDAGRRDEARAHYRRAQAIFLKALGPDHPHTRGVTGYLRKT